MSNDKIRIMEGFATAPHTCHCETGGGRCDICFGPVEKSYPHEKPLPENVIPLGIITFNDVDPETILRMAYDAEIVDICVVGMTKTGDEFFASSTSDAAETIYHLTRAIHKLNNMIDRIASGDGNVG